MWKRGRSEGLGEEVSQWIEKLELVIRRER
jgi:hypothetical protein